MRRYLVAGNWKMNTTRAVASELAYRIADGVKSPLPRTDVLVCPPFPYLAVVRDVIEGAGVALGAQNGYHQPPGAFTGEVSMDMLVDVGCTAVILGHSERRHVLQETDVLINAKVKAACQAGLQVLLCVGELLAEREGNRMEAVLDQQMSAGLEGVDGTAMERIVIAYEPVWAIGTGKTASPEQAQAAHAHLRNWLRGRYNPTTAEATRILYGGSVKPDNALELMRQPDVDGALVGGACLKADSFLAIVQAAEQAGR
jgi:triosephosphate isomerase